MGERDIPAKDHFEAPQALAVLLANDVIFLNDHWWEETWPDDAKKLTSLNVGCNDIFAWASADAQGLQYREIEPLYRMWQKDRGWGPAVWCMIKRNEKPQPPVEREMRTGGIWEAFDLDSFKLGENHTDAEVQAMFAAYAQSAALVTTPSKL